MIAFGENWSYLPYFKLMTPYPKVLYKSSNDEWSCPMERNYLSATCAVSPD